MLLTVSWPMQQKMRQVIRSDSFSWKGKRWGGWSASCDAMPSGGPSEDPKADMDITNDYEPVDYATNDSPDRHGRVR